MTFVSATVHSPFLDAIFNFLFLELVDDNWEKNGGVLVKEVDMIQSNLEVRFNF